MQKILLVSDSGVASGYGRIADSVAVRLMQRGFKIFAASFAYDGLLPAMLNGNPLPYHVATLQLKRQMGTWVEDVVKLVGAVNPDVVLVIQDAPYAEAVRNAPIDWSRHKFCVITPVDGVPISPNWVKMMREADGAMSISEFGVQAYRELGVQATLCRPGINPNEFFRYPDAHKQALRQKMGIPEGAFVLGTMAQNQGRKAITKMLEGFFRFAKDKPNALYLLDMDKVSPVGWNIPHVCEQRGWDVKRLIFREDCFAKGIHELRDRYNLLDAHAVLSHREGYGLPLAEAMACGVVSVAMDYCSGREIVGDGKGLLIKPIDYVNVSTWGGADDYFPDIDDFVKQMGDIYHNKPIREMIAQKGMEWARRQSWDMATDGVYEMLVNLKRVQQVPAPPIEDPIPVQAPLPVAPKPMAVAVEGITGESVVLANGGIIHAQDVAQGAD